MKRVINGKTYNTETAIKIAGWDNGKYLNDFYHAYSNLYKSKKGQFFCTGNDGFISELNQGERELILIDQDGALEWINYHNIDPDDIANFNEYFECEEG